MFPSDASLNPVAAGQKPLSPNGAGKKILIAVDDLFFLAKIQETAKKLGIALEFARSSDEVLVKIEDSPTLVIFDLNRATLKPIETIARIRREPKYKKTSLVGFVSHIEADLKQQAQQAGCDMVMPRSAFSQNLPALLRRHGLPEPQ